MCLIGLKNEETRAAADLRIKKMYMLHVSNRVKQWGREGSSRPTSKDMCLIGLNNGATKGSSSKEIVYNRDKERGRQGSSSIKTYTPTARWLCNDIQV